ncbi:MAG: molybdate ABC transporter substrate-binding protein [Methanomicrobiales archaeon HGW-Methanomicrobiales-3]|jgi:molybdate transport system substrate-binding protein|nr:MAG: molybdate ABC transporter substrate-binding protein [Methanomicrobiales archaeon HGW-Methanomicrobiales-3]
MTQKTNRIILISIVTALLIITALLAGCTGTTPDQPAAPAGNPVAGQETGTPLIPASGETTAPAGAATTATPKPVYTASESAVIAYTAASLKGASAKLAEGYTAMYPGRSVVFNLDGTQALTTQIENGAYADVFISASPKYTKQLTSGGYFVDGTVKTLTTNYVIVIVPAENPAAITSLADLAKPGVKIARAAATVPVGIATDAAIGNLATSTYGKDWNDSVNKNTVTYETSEPAVATKVALGEVDAGFVYESTATAAKTGTYKTVEIPKSDNYLQTYSIAVLEESTKKTAADDFEKFMLSDAGQQILRTYGFRTP